MVRPLMQRKMTTVLIVTVRDDEIRSLKDAFPDDQSPGIISAQAPEFDNQETVYRGWFSSESLVVKVFLVQQTETGQEDAAAVTTRFIHRIRAITGVRPDYAVLVGICAGSQQRRSTARGDVVIPPHIYDESVYKIGQQKNIFQNFVFQESRMNTC